ncbi:hypothetical protein CERSUDRAFT_93416 [Gelatoporia subvermispora B]|uniref:superoxide dismutase n=1 Tax=Ceriporiopsis subvermispora (strain B) TaxID=914234 RepID=M2RLP0_CERS8|nr:hypothetical protein CERSUDRAFT_93416 [Gelatoporia subvermispora B]
MPLFKEKEEQRAKVQSMVAAKFYSHLGIDDTYFANESIEVISDHIIALFGAKVLAYTKHDLFKRIIDLENIDPNGKGATFIHTSPPGLTITEGPGSTCEARIDELYLDKSTPTNAYRLETYRSQGSISATASQQLRCYFVDKCNFPQDPPPSMRMDGKTDIRTVSDPVFLEKASENTLEIYQRVMWHVETRHGPVIEVFEVEGSRERRLVIGYKIGGTNKFFSALPNLYHFYSLYSARKYVEQFSNGITIISLYLNPLPGANTPPIEHSIFQVMKEASLLYCLPDNPFFYPGAGPRTEHAVQEATYAYCGWVFAQHFCNRLGASYFALKNILDESNPSHAEVLNDIKCRFREETFTRESIAQVIHVHADLINLLYVNFAMVHYPTDSASQLMPTLSYQRLQTQVPLSDQELYNKIRHSMHNKHELQVLESFLIFNKHVLKTNFYQPTKVALSFHLAPDFLPEVDYPKKPFGMFFAGSSVASTFASGMSLVAVSVSSCLAAGSTENYSINQRMLFDEKEWYVQAVKALSSAHALQVDHPELHVRLVHCKRTAAPVVTSTITKLVLDEQSVELLNSQYLQQHSGNARAVLATAKASRLLQTSQGEVKNTLFTVLNPDVSFDIKPLYSRLLHHNAPSCFSLLGGHSPSDLPYPYNALEPIISRQIVKLHHEKHHQKYVNALSAGEHAYAEASTHCGRIALQAALKSNVQCDEFRKLAEPYLYSGLRKGIPSLFADIKALYSDA